MCGFHVRDREYWREVTELRRTDLPYSILIATKVEHDSIAVIRGDRLCQIAHIVFVQKAGVELLIELGALSELTHFQGVFNGPALTTNLRTLLAAAYRHDVEI